MLDTFVSVRPGCGGVHDRGTVQNTPILIPGNSLLREADIVTPCPRTRQGGSGLILSSVPAHDTERKIG